MPGPAEAAHFVRQLRGSAGRSAIRALLDAPIVIVTLKRRGVRPLLSATHVVRTTHDPGRSAEVSAAVDAALGLIPASPTCLRRSVTLLRELHRLRLGATMHIGVRKVGGVIEAHAWVQSGDVVINDDPEVTGGYVELARGELETFMPLLR